MTVAGILFDTLTFSREDLILLESHQFAWQTSPWIIVYAVIQFGALLIWWLRNNDSPVGRRNRNWFGILGTTADFVFLFALDSLSGAICLTVRKLHTM